MRRLLNHRGFTLIELLVVVAIIALLISILLPSLSRARETARTVACSSILKQFALANVMYADSEDNYFVPITDRTQVPDWIWAWNTKYREMIGLAERRGVPPGLLCPGKPDDINRHILGERFALWNTYGMNRSGVDRTGTPPNHAFTYFRPTVLAPSTRLQMTEANTFLTALMFANYNTKWDLTGESNTGDGGQNSLTYRHMEGANVQYFDGHVAYQAKEEVFSDSPQERRRLWFPYGFGN